MLYISRLSVLAALALVSACGVPQQSQLQAVGNFQRIALVSEGGLHIDVNYQFQQPEVTGWQPLSSSPGSRSDLFYPATSTLQTAQRAKLSFVITSSQQFNSTHLTAQHQSLTMMKNQIYVTTFCAGQQPETLVVDKFQATASWQLYGAQNVIVPTQRVIRDVSGKVVALAGCKTEIAVGVDNVFEVDPWHAAQGGTASHNFILELK